MKESRLRALVVSALSLLSLWLLSGCTLQGEILDLSETRPVVQLKTQVKEFTPLSQQHAVTAQGYKVQSSMDFYKSPAESRTAAGYKVQTSIQTLLFNEQR